MKIDNLILLQNSNLEGRRKFVGFDQPYRYLPSAGLQPYRYQLNAGSPYQFQPRLGLPYVRLLPAGRLSSAALIVQRSPPGRGGFTAMRGRRGDVVDGRIEERAAAGAGPPTGFAISRGRKELD